VTTAAADFDAIADDLYGLRPDEFTTARNAKASEARTSGDRAMSKAIKELRRPTTSAWLANWLVRERTDEFGRLQSLRASMRDASDRLDGDDLRRLSRQRHEVLAALTAAARGAASDAGIPFSGAVSGELEATLMAALSDEEAAAALEQGRLTTALRYTGFGTTGLTWSAQPTRKSREERPIAEYGALEKAEHELGAVRKDLDEHDQIADEARARRDDLGSSMHDLEAQLEVLRAEEAKVTMEATAADESRQLAQKAVRAAERQVDVARRRLEAKAK
jgi:hypothetical protein